MRKLESLCTGNATRPCGGCVVYADLEGTVESVDAKARSFVVQGITVATNERTEYEDGLTPFEDIQAGQQLEVDIEIWDGRHIAKEVELEERGRIRDVRGSGIPGFRLAAVRLRRQRMGGLRPTPPATTPSLGR